ncbi:MAG TPA: mucoidy inhibitor MuiA family protein [Chloroflexia bacterium]|nr:mucoidy inhibitor MuiA family protein [Chloroflexia bacterium]
MVSLSAPIVEVTVYTDRARITRRGSVHLTQGEHTLTLEGLPTTVQDDSVRASGRGVNVRILGVDLAREYVTQAPEADLAELKSQLEILQDKDQVLADDDAQETRRLAQLDSLRESSGSTLTRGIAYGKSGLEEVSAFIKYLADETSAVQARRREIALQRRKLAREIEALQSKLSPRWDTNERISLNVAVEATEETDLDLDLIYSVTNASWEPLYDIRLVENKVAVTYLANIRQQTGEDWPAVTLSLSTARPAISSTIPELRPWYVDVYRPPVMPPAMPRAAAPMMQTTGASMKAMAAESTAPVAAFIPPPAEIAEATVESSGAAVTYRVARPVAVPSDGSPHKTTVTTLDLEAKLDYVTVPKLAEEAYLRAKIKNSSALILLPGSANIFHEADFIGRTFIKTVVPSEEFEAQLGVDDRVKVKRELTERTAGKAFIGNTKRTGLGYKIKVTSHLAWPTRVTVMDQVPVSRHEQIKVKLTEVSPEPTEHNDLNILKWELQMAPQSAQEITYAFTLENPREMTVTGMAE